MRAYSLHDVIFAGKDRYLTLQDEKGRDVAHLRKAALHGQTFSYTSPDGETVVSIRFTAGGRFAKSRYEVHANENQYVLQGNAITNSIYFCIKGTIENHRIVLEENWAGDVEMKVNKQVAAVIRDYWGDSRVVFGFGEEVEEHSLLFALHVLIYFMLKMYEKENRYIDEVFSKVPQVKG